MKFIKAGWVGFGMLWALTATASDGIDLVTGQQEVYTHPQAIKRIAVGNPDIAGVSMLTSRNVMITGKKSGATEMRIWESEQEAQPARVIKVTVANRVDREQQRLGAVEAEALQAVAAGGGVALTGQAASLEKHALAQQSLDPEYKGPLDASVSDFDHQVQIDIKIVEVSRQSLMRAGFFLTRSGDHSTIAIGAPGTISGIESTADGLTIESSGGFLPFLNAFNVVFNNTASQLLSTISVLEANGFAYTLAEPSLTAISGQSASFLAGGEFPIPIRTGSGADSSITINYKEYGVRLMLAPTVLDSNRIFLKVSPEVSELDFNNVVQTGGVTVPGLRVRRTDTSVSLGNGESFVISGLVSRNTLSNVDKFPWLGDLPVIGAFFRSTRFDREDKELLMVVTPHLVRPLARDAKLPPLPGSDVRDYKPSFSELFFQTNKQPGTPVTGMSR